MGPFDGMHALVAMLPLDARARIISQYRAGLDELVAQAGELLNGANPADAQAPVHKLAGSAALMRDENLSGMLREIERRLNVPLAGVPFVGDSLKDLQAAEAAGARPILVLTGKGRKTRDAGGLPEGTEVFADLATFAAQLVEQRGA